MEKWCRGEPIMVRFFQGAPRTWRSAPVHHHAGAQFIHDIRNGRIRPPRSGGHVPTSFRNGPPRRWTSRPTHEARSDPHGRGWRAFSRPRVLLETEAAAGVGQTAAAAGVGGVGAGET